MLHSKISRKKIEKDVEKKPSLFEQFFLNDQTNPQPKLKLQPGAMGTMAYDCRHAARTSDEGLDLLRRLLPVVFLILVVTFFLFNNINMINDIKQGLLGFSQLDMKMPEISFFDPIKNVAPDNTLLHSVNEARAFITISTKSLLLMGHVIGLVLGFGVAIFLDILLARHLYHKTITLQTCETIELGSKLVGIGLALLWFTGLGFLVMYGLENPEKLANPKIWAKVPVVVLLTLNGFALHHYVLPQLEKKIGKTLWQGDDMRQIVAGLVLGAISFTSWFFAFSLGMCKEFNFSFSSLTLLTGYFALVTLVMSVMIFSYLIISSFGKNSATQTGLAE